MATQRGKFTVPQQSSAPPRADRSRTPSLRTASTVPKASQIVEGPRPSKMQRQPANAPVTVCVYKVTDHAGDIWSEQEGKEVALWQVQIDHPARPTITFSLKDSFEDFLKSAKEEDSSIPGSLE